MPTCDHAWFDWSNRHIQATFYVCHRCGAVKNSDLKIDLDKVAWLPGYERLPAKFVEDNPLVEVVARAMFGSRYEGDSRVSGDIRQLNENVNWHVFTREAKAAIAAIESWNKSRSEWRPMDTAPIDESTPILACFKKSFSPTDWTRRVKIVRRVQYCERWREHADSSFTPECFDGWQPLPAPKE